MGGMLHEALRGALDAVAEEDTVLERLQRAGQLASAAAADIGTGTRLMPGIARALHVHRQAFSAKRMPSVQLCAIGCV